MFIARTQEAHDWENPVYQLTASQSRTWGILVGETQKITAPRDESDRDSDNDGRDSNRGSNRVRNSGRNSGSNNGRNSGSNNSRNNGEPTLIMIDAHKACLKFCTELLQQRITRKEYDSALICALAVLGVKNDG
jgi:hypothetical protein